MNKCIEHKHVFSMAERIGIIAFMLAFFLGLIHVRLATLPLTVFLLMCFAAPLMPSISFFLPIVSRGLSEKKAVALTFDDGPDPVSTPKLLDLLAKYQVRATFFVTGKKAEKFPEMIRDILSHGHTIGNHTYSHDNFIMLKKSHALMKEIEDTQKVLHQFGIAPIAFRPPVGVTSPRLKKVLDKVGMVAVNFSRRAGDLGNRRVKHISKRILKRLHAGDIIMLHDTPPHNKALAQCWLGEMERVLVGVKYRGLAIVPLENLIGLQVMSVF
jgi:peptidoglycan-N-acetylglucosamine deacetylase